LRRTDRTYMMKRERQRGIMLTTTRRSKEERRAWYQEALDSLEHFERTGLHITFEEYSAWVDRLDTDPDAPFPKCHT